MTGLHLARYRIDAELGRGGMGIVYRATDTMLDRTVDMKVLEVGLTNHRAARPLNRQTRGLNGHA